MLNTTSLSLSARSKMGVLESGHLHLHPLRRYPSKPGGAHLQGQVCQPGPVDTGAGPGQRSRCRSKHQHGDIFHTILMWYSTQWLGSHVIDWKNWKNGSVPLLVIFTHCNIMCYLCYNVLYWVSARKHINIFPPKNIPLTLTNQILFLFTFRADFPFHTKNLSLFAAYYKQDCGEQGSKLGILEKMRNKL